MVEQFSQKQAGIGEHGFKDDAPRAAAVVRAAATAWEAAAREDGDAGEEAVEERNVGRSCNMEEGEEHFQCFACWNNQ